MGVLDLDKLIIFILFVIPGFISLKIYELFFPSEQKNSSKQIIDAITYSCINYGILAIPIFTVEYYAIKDNYPFWYYMFYFLVLFIFPVLWTYIWAKIRESDKIQDIAPHPHKKAWDYIFSKRESYWIKITLKNGTVVGGLYDCKSFASSSPSKEHIYLEESWKIKKDGTFKKMKNDSKGILILQKQIAYMEFRSLNKL